MCVEAIGFDLDETLIYTSRGRGELLSETAAEHDVAELSRQAYREAHRNEDLTETRLPIFDSLLVGADEATDPASVTETYRDLVADSVVAIPNCRELIRRLTAEYSVGLLTNGPRRAQQSKLSQFAWSSEFDAVRIEGDVGYGKPHSRAFRDLVRALDATPEETVYVGNEIETDIRSAKRVGLRTIQVVYSGGPEPHPEADAHVPRDRLAEELFDVLAEMES